MNRTICIYFCQVEYEPLLKNPINSRTRLTMHVRNILNFSWSFCPPSLKVRTRSISKMSGHILHLYYWGQAWLIGIIGTQIYANGFKKNFYSDPNLKKDLMGGKRYGVNIFVSVIISSHTVSRQVLSSQEGTWQPPGKTLLNGLYV